MKKWNIPWLFVVDLLLAAIPTAQFAFHRGGWPTYLIYWLVLAVLRFSDNFAVRKNWRTLSRIILKAVVVIVAEALVSLSLIEVCDINGENCRRLFF